MTHSTYDGAPAVLRDAQRLDQLRAENGGELLETEVATEMKTLASRLQINVKELGRLGALSGPDLGLIEKHLAWYLMNRRLSPKRGCRDSNPLPHCGSRWSSCQRSRRTRSPCVC